MVAPKYIFITLLSVQMVTRRCDVMYMPVYMSDAVTNRLTILTDVVGFAEWRSRQFFTLPTSQGHRQGRDR